MNKKQKLLDKLYALHRDFHSSPLYIDQSTSIVFGEGSPDAEILFIGEAPGKNEEIEKRPFVGQSGKLLNQALESSGLNRTDVYITNIVKCRPPDNRTPSPKELATGREIILLEQIKIIAPRVICTLGSAALRGLTQKPYKITEIRGQTIYFQGTKVIPTYHPAYILRSRSKTPIFLSDIQKLTQL